MTLSIRNLVRAATRTKEDKLNILCFPFNGIFEHFLADTGHNIYIVPETSVLPINPQDELNLHVIGLNKQTQQIDIPNELDIDLVVSNTVNNFGNLENVCNMLHVPGTIIHHFYPDKDNIDISFVEKFNNIVLFEEFNELWNINGDIVNYYFPNEPITTVKQHVMVTGNLTPEHLELINRLKEKFTPIAVVDLNNPPPFEVTKSLLTTTSHIVNINTVMSVNWVALFGAKMGIPMVSTDNPMNKLYLKNYGVVTNNVQEIINFIETTDSTKKHSIQGSPVSAWDNVFRKHADVVYKGY